MNSIRRQLTRGLLGTTLALLGIALATLLGAAGYAVVEQFDAALRAKALAISTLTTATPEGVRVDFTDRFFRGFDDHEPRDFFQIWREDGTVLARSESLEASDLPRRAGHLAKPKFWFFTLPNGEAGRALAYVFKPKAAGGAEAPELTLVVASDRDALDDGLELLVGLGAGTTALLACVTLWLVPRVLGRGLAPLAALAEQASRIDAASLATRFPSADLPAELQPIAGRWNELLARLEESFERERRYSADLAHELRTPLAELRSLAECALKWPEAREATTDREVLAIAEQMEALVTRMLALARGEQGKLGAKLERLELVPAVEAAWAPFTKRAAERGLTVEWQLAAVSAEADAVLLRSVLGNLFDNAVDYAPAGGVVRIALVSAAGGAEFRVANAAAGLTAEDVSKIFERFWRKEAARSGGQHAGLGLPLARTFAMAMGWTLTAALDERGWLVFTLAAKRSMRDAASTN